MLQVKPRSHSCLSIHVLQNLFEEERKKWERMEGHWRMKEWKVIFWKDRVEFEQSKAARARICKRFRSPGIDSKESIPPAYVSLRADTSNRVATVPPGWKSIPGLLKRFTNTGSGGLIRQKRFVLRQAGNWFLGSIKGLQIRALLNKWIPDCTVCSIYNK